jgi:hypothetical protein
MDANIFRLPLRRLSRPERIGHDRVPRPRIAEPRPVTVCVAVLFHWNYAPAGQPLDYRPAALIASDRMITAGDVQYEPQQLKVANLTSRVVGMVAGDYTVHSQAIREIQDANKDRSETVSPYDIALQYGRAMQAIRRRWAEDLYLAPFGLTIEGFLAQQRELAPQIVDHLTTQLQGYTAEECEALVVGSNGKQVELYQVDNRGMVRRLDDVGFAAIGIGAWHAKSRLMQVGYHSKQMFNEALAAVYAAKKNGEIAPGVGTETDITLILDAHVGGLRDDFMNTLQRMYAKYDTARRAMGESFVAELREALAAESVGGQQSGPLGQNAQVNGRAGEAASETSEVNEAPEQKTGT